jgi:UDP-glucose 4-epimerase
VRVLITGVGGELGSRVAARLEAMPEVTDLLGIDIAAPALELERTRVTVLDPRERRLVTAAVSQFQPTAVVHLGIYEPDARSTPRAAVERTAAGTTTVLGVAAELGCLDRIVIRSGLEVYGRRRNSPSVPDESVVPDPTTPFGRSVLRAEQLAQAIGEESSVPVAAIRFAPIVGPNFPSPLARYLRLRIVPVSAIAEPPFSILHHEDAADAVVDALMRRLDGPLNVLGPGSVTMTQAIRLGRRIPLRLLGPQWTLARSVSSALGSPIPDHLLELLQRGRTADGSRAESLGLRPRPTRELIRDLFEWPTVPLAMRRREAA